MDVNPSDFYPPHMEFAATSSWMGNQRRLPTASQARLEHAMRAGARSAVAPRIVTPKVEPPKVIGILTGRAAPFGEWDAIARRDQDPLHELFRPYCFEQSTKRGGQILELNHDGVSIPCRMVFGDQFEGLDFYASIFDSVRGRFLAGLFKGCEVTGVSVRFNPVRMNRDKRRDRLGENRVVEEADLVAIGICWGAKRPALHGTYATFHSMAL